MKSVKKFRTERGYNLIEVLIATALLGVVIIGIMTLFFIGRRNVYSGKQMTQAVAMATHVQEDMMSFDKSKLVSTFGLGTGVGSTNTVNGVTFNNSFMRTTTNITSTTDPKGFLARWRDEMVNNKKFSDGVLTVVMTPTADPSNTPAQMATATVIQTRVYMMWNEESRPRVVSLDMVKIQR
jgi:prepilin-type N-terminal cleavage/methylation domain-containing protein